MNRLPRRLIILARPAVLGLGLAMLASFQAQATCLPMAALKQESSGYGPLTFRSAVMTMAPAQPDQVRGGEGWAAVGAKPDKVGCADFGKGGVVYLKEGQYTTTVVEVGLPFEVRVVVPSYTGAPEAGPYVDAVRNAFQKISPQFPLGPNPEVKAPFHFIVTAGALSESVQPEAGKLLVPEGNADVGFLFRLPGDWLFQEQVHKAVVKLYTQARPHPKQGPVERQKIAEKKLVTETTVIDLPTYNGITENLLSFMALPPEQRLVRAQVALMDFAGVTDPSRTLLPTSDILKNLRLEKLDAKVFQEKNARAFVEETFSLTYALYVSSRLRQVTDTRPLDDLLKLVNAGTFPSLKEPIEASNLASSTFDFQEFASFVITPLGQETVLSEVLRRNGFAVKRPDINPITSEGATLDGRLYVQNPDAPAHKVFLLTHDNPNWQAALSPYDLTARDLISKLLTKGDVFVLHRRARGLSIGGHRESAGPCKARNYLEPARNAGFHIVDAAQWLKRRNYENIIGVSSGMGALAMMSAAGGQTPLSEIIVYNPLRGVKADRSGFCMPDRFKTTLKALRDGVKVPMQVLVRSNAEEFLPENERKLESEITDLWAEVFPNAVKVDPTQVRWIPENLFFFEAAPSVWLPSVKGLNN